MPLQITAIVPTWNEAGQVGRTLANLRRAGVDELIVVDAGSRDGTLEEARPLADRVLEVGGGLFAQLNAGASEARGDVLLFHYADVELPGGARAEIERVLSGQEVAGGAFLLSFASPRHRYQVIAAGANLRNRLGLGPFGDQSLFIRTRVFRALGGYDPVAYLADLDLVRRVRRAGGFAVTSLAVRASVRRWERHGTLRTLLEHWWLTLRYVAGRRRVASPGVGRSDELRTIR